MSYDILSNVFNRKRVIPIFQIGTSYGFDERQQTQERNLTDRRETTNNDRPIEYEIYDSNSNIKIIGNFNGKSLDIII